MRSRRALSNSLTERLAKSMSPSMVAEASKAHHALMRSLSKSLEGIEH